MNNRNHANDELTTRQSPLLQATRRSFLRASLLGTLGAVVSWPAFGRRALGAEPGAEGCCVALGNHWSYTGIGWQLGIESDVLSVLDAMEIVDQPPHVKTCINLDARAYEVMMERFPEVAERLKRYLAAGKLELIGGTYGQPMGTTISGESNIRQLVVGREAIRQAMGYEMVTFLEEEEFTHPQVPQIAVGAGYRYASMTQLDTWGRTGIPMLEHNVILWKGMDGTTIPCVPRHSLSAPGLDTRTFPKNPAFQKLAALGRPLVFGWEEFGWEDPEHPAYQTAAAKPNPLPDLYPVGWGTLNQFKALAGRMPVEFVTLSEYLDKYGKHPEETVFLPMSAFQKWLTWGLGGDQVRILARKVEGVLLAAELFDAAAGRVAGRRYTGGTPVAPAGETPAPRGNTGGTCGTRATLELAWKDFLASESHDVGLCEYSRWQGERMAPLDRIEDKHNSPWGLLGYQLLDSAQERGQTVLGSSLEALAAAINSRGKQRRGLVATVFNSLGHERTDLVMMGKLYPLPAKTRGFRVQDRAGQGLPVQVVKAEQDHEGNFIMAELAFPAAKVPAAGYDTYYLEPVPSAPAPEKTALSVDESTFKLENEQLRVLLDPATGAVASLVHKPSGREMIAGEKGAFPRFTGKPNPNLSRRPSPPDHYDSATSKGRLDWVAKGPLLATVRAHHRWKYLNFETRVTLAAGRPYVEILTRVFAQVPPLFTGTGPLDRASGYWLSFQPAFAVSQAVRDYPLAVEATDQKTFHALTFADLLGAETGLLLLHAGTQWFARDDQGIVGNVIIREWESLFTNEYGWPLYSEYRHALWPHGAEEMNNAARLRAAAGFTQPLLCHVGAAHGGRLLPAGSFVKLSPDTLLLSAFRQTPDGLELRVLENEGKTLEAAVEIGFPVKSAVETDLLGRKLKSVSLRGNRLTFRIEPWKVRTFRMT